jgi:U3 small nucleolar RNA-associated protein 22
LLSPLLPALLLPARRQEEEAVEALVRRALTNRALLVRALQRPLAFPEASGAGDVVGALASGLAAPASRRVLVGAVVDGQEAQRLVDVGPPADDAAAAARFRALWGDRSELRRFQDGKICEAVAWEAPPGSRHTIPDAAVSHVLGRHLARGARIDCSAGRLDAALAPQPPALGRPGAVAAGRAAEAALDKLGKQLRALGEVVLKVVGVQPLSAASRRTAPFVPEPHPLVGGPGGLAAAAASPQLPRCLEPLEVMVQLEGSGGRCGLFIGVFGGGPRASQYVDIRCFGT